MVKGVFLFMLLIAMGCGKSKSLYLQPQEGLTIVISDIRLEKFKNRITGFVQIENTSESFVKISNQELFLYSGKDSSRTFVSMPGEWKIDEGLINILKGKTITYHAYWPIDHLSDTLTVNYVKVIPRDEE